mgnify:FL=1|jgi:DNA gyrase/topoisomerase IV subunit B|tara:strand:- start:17768 stop:18259 length:492 start_codon:yes stop_codon:yes gene_type:complete
MSSTELIDPEKLSPEGLKVAEAYIMSGGDIEKTSLELGLPVADLQSELNKREIKEYVDRIYHEAGFRNRFKMARVMDELIAKKLEEMDDTDMGSSKDILDLLQAQHAMKMKELEFEAKVKKELLELERKKEEVQIKNQTNNQYNNYVIEESSYDKLISKLGSS